MSKRKGTERVDTVRRKLLKSSMVAGGFLAAGHLPYVKPAVKSFFGVRTAWAQPSGLFTAQFIGSLADLGGGLGTGQDAWELTTTQSNTTLTINVTITSGSPAEEIGLFAPGIPTTGTNLLTGTGGGFPGPFPVMILVATAGTYTLAIANNDPDFAETPFSYVMDIVADLPIVPGSLVTANGTESLGPAGGG